MGHVVETLCGLLASEDFDTAGYAANLCTMQTVISTNPDQDKREKQTEGAVRLSMFNSRFESLVGTCVVSCVRAKQGPDTERRVGS